MIDCSGFPHLLLELGSAVYTGRHFYYSKAVCQFSRARQFAVAYWSTLDLLQLRPASSWPIPAGHTVWILYVVQSGSMNH